MTDLHGRCSSKIARILRASSNAAISAHSKVVEAKATLASTPDAEPKTENELLRDCLKDAESAHAAALKRLDQIGQLPLWKRMWHRTAAERDVAAAAGALNRKLQFEMQAVAVRKRKEDCDLRRSKHAAHIASREALRRAEGDLKLRVQEHAALKQLCEPIVEALTRKAWIDPDAEALLDLSVTHLQHQRLEATVKVIQAINFQKLPSENQFEKWALEHQAVLNRMRLQSAGFAATAAYPGLVNPSLELVKRRFHVGVWSRSVERYEDCPDRWHALPVCMLTHRALIEPTQWVIYWALLVGCQRFAEVSSQASIHEDVLTGMLTQGLSGQLQDFAKKRLLQLGYPKAKANLGFLHLAGKKGEFATGADIGLVVLLDVGDLHVHKVALLQAKVSIDGRADIGSRPSGPEKRTQLQKLRDAERDFFVFYHATTGASPSPLPTVTSVKQLVESLNLNPDDLSKPKINVQPRLQGWDLATFVAFGLCTPANAIGKEVAKGDDALEAMYAGGRKSLPEYMIIVSIGQDEAGYHNVISPLQREGYRAIQQGRRGNVLQRRQAVERDHDGPELG